MSSYPSLDRNVAVQTLNAADSIATKQVAVDEIKERTLESGVSVLSELKVNLISERSAEFGVTIDGVQLKDGKIAGTTPDYVSCIYATDLAVANTNQTNPSFTVLSSSGSSISVNATIITVNATGIYQFGFFGTWDALTTGGVAHAHLENVENSVHGTVKVPLGNAMEVTTNVHTTVFANAGDTFKINLAQNDSVSVNVNRGAGEGLFVVKLA